MVTIPGTPFDDALAVDDDYTRWSASGYVSLGRKPEIRMVNNTCHPQFTVCCLHICKQCRRTSCLSGCLTSQTCSFLINIYRIHWTQVYILPWIDGEGALHQHAAIISQTNETVMWESGMLAMESPWALTCPTIITMGLHFTQRWAGTLRPYSKPV